MAKRLDQTGVIQVNGAWVTRIQYSAAALGPATQAVDLRFMQGRAEVARVSLPRAELDTVLGPENRAAIERHLANDADKYLAVVTGELRGRRLHYREVTLAPVSVQPDQNVITPTPTREQGSPPETKISRDAAPDGGQAESAAAAGPAAADAPEPEAVNRQRANPDTSAQPNNAAPTPVPAHIAAKYLVNGNTYHFDDQTVAFVDQGTRLTAQTHNKSIIQDLVAIAQARQWQAITVSGTRAFRRAAWKEATAAGLTVTGYNPSTLERAALDRQRNRSAPEGPADGIARPPDPPPEPPPAAAPRATPQESSAQKAAAGVLFGQWVAHGEAPYRHDPSQSPSYFVTVKDLAGQERTAWGVGLKDAIRDSQTAPSVNDVIGIRRTGTTPVTVVQRSIDANGEIIAQTINAKRQGWEVEKAQFFTQPRAAEAASQPPPTAPQEGDSVGKPTEAAPPEPRDTTLTRDQQAAAAIRSATITREELQLKYPELNRAVFQHMASHEQFAEAYVKAGLIRESDRAQVIAQMRERLAGKVATGAPLRAPDDQAVTNLIRRSVNRVAADIGRAPLNDQPPTAEPPLPRAPGREDAQVRM